MKVLTPTDYAAQLRARIRRDGWHATARALGCAVTTLQNVTNARNLPNDALLEATGYVRMYRNGRGRPKTSEELRAVAGRLVANGASYQDAAEALGVPKMRLWSFVNGTTPLHPKMVETFGFTPVFVAVDKRPG